MDTNRAFEVLGLDRKSSAEDIEERFRTLANQHHPDRGGTNELMAQLNEARSVALGAIEYNTTLVPLEALNAAMTALADRQEKRQLLDRRIDSTTKHLHARSTSKYRRNRRVAGILSAVAAAAIFLGKEISIDMFVPIISPRTSSVVSSEVTDRQEQEARQSFVAMWNTTLLGVALYAGLAAWFLSRRIDKVERDLDELEENTGTRTLLHVLLKEILQNKIQQRWTLDEFAELISQEVTVPERYRFAAQQIGSFRFAQLLLDRAQQLGLIAVQEEILEEIYVEFYCIAGTSGEFS